MTTEVSPPSREPYRSQRGRPASLPPGGRADKQAAACRMVAAQSVERALAFGQLAHGAAFEAGSEERREMAEARLELRRAQHAYTEAHRQRSPVSRVWTGLRESLAAAPPPTAVPRRQDGTPVKSALAGPPARRGGEAVPPGDRQRVRFAPTPPDAAVAPTAASDHRAALPTDEELLANLLRDL